MSKDKPTSAPLPAAHHASARGDALRNNLSRRKQQTRDRKDADTKSTPPKENK